MQVLFLDFDGVLRVRARKGASREWSRAAIKNLVELLRVFPEMRIVVSSAWRTTRTDEELKALIQCLGFGGERYAGKTATLPGATRSAEIADWISKATDVRWVALDDNDLGTSCCRFQVRPDYRFGLRFEDCKKAVRMLDAQAGN